MARTPKSTLEFAPLDIDLFNDVKIRKLIKFQGAKAIAIYSFLLCSIYKNGYYIKWNGELSFICSEATGVELAYIVEVLRTCLKLGLFSKQLFDSDWVLTSKEIQLRYSHIYTQYRRVCNIQDFRLIELVADKKRNMPKPLTKKESLLKPRVEIYSLTLEQEIETLKNDNCWLDQLQILHHTDINRLRDALDDFLLHCKADGKTQHSSLQDAKHHFNSWFRIINNNKSKTNDNNKSDRRNSRRCNFLATDEQKTYGSSF